MSLRVACQPMNYDAIKALACEVKKIMSVFDEMTEVSSALGPDDNSYAIVAVANGARGAYVRNSSPETSTPRPSSYSAPYQNSQESQESLNGSYVRQSNSTFQRQASQESLNGEYVRQSNSTFQRQASDESLGGVGVGRAYDAFPVWEDDASVDAAIANVLSGFEDA
jgi:hypothetical protein